MRVWLVLALNLSALALLSGIGGCKKETGWKTRSFEEVRVKPQARDVQIPAELWEKLDAAPPAAAGAPVEKPQRAPTVFEPLKVYLIERNKGVLKTGDTVISFAAGGGELDLSEFVQPLRGSFHVVFEFLPTVEAPQTKVFFLSYAVARTIGGDKVGAGCETYFDISQAVDKAYKGEGLLMNTSEQRHVSALAGTYVFASSHDGKLHLSSLTIRDSQFRSLQCRR